MDLLDESAKGYVTECYNRIMNQQPNRSSGRTTNNDGTMYTGKDLAMLKSPFENVLKRIAPNDINPADVYKTSQIRYWNEEMDFILRGLSGSKKEQIKKIMEKHSGFRGMNSGMGGNHFRNPNDETFIDVPDEQINYIKNNYGDRNFSSGEILRRLFMAKTKDNIPTLRKLGAFQPGKIQNDFIRTMIWNVNPFLADCLIEIYKNGVGDQPKVCEDLVSALVHHWSDSTIPLIRETWEKSPDKRKLIAMEMKKVLIPKGDIQPMVDLLEKETTDEIRLELLPVIDMLKLSKAKGIIEKWASSAESDENKSRFVGEIKNLEIYHQKVIDLIADRIKPDDLLPYCTYVWDGDKYILKKD